MCVNMWHVQACYNTHGGFRDQFVGFDSLLASCGSWG